MTWAMDGAWAMALQGLRTDPGFPEVVVVLDDAMRWWGRAIAVRCPLPDGGLLNAWLDAELEEALSVTSEPSVCPFGYVHLRFVAALPSVVRVEVPGSDVVLPVLPLEEVERAHPQHADVVARWRQRRSLGT